MEHGFLKGLVSCDCHALSLVTGDADCHTQWESLDFAALFLTAHFDHRDGDVRAWQTGDECLVGGYVGEREIDNRIALGLVGLGTGRFSKLDVNEVSDGAIEDELLHHEVGEQHDFATRTQSVVHRERIPLRRQLLA